MDPDGSHCCSPNPATWQQTTYLYYIIPKRRPNLKRNEWKKMQGKCGKVGGDPIFMFIFSRKGLPDNPASTSMFAFSFQHLATLPLGRMKTPRIWQAEHSHWDYHAPKEQAHPRHRSRPSCHRHLSSHASTATASVQHDTDYPARHGSMLLPLSWAQCMALWHTRCLFETSLQAAPIV